MPFPAGAAALLASLLLVSPAALAAADGPPELPGLDGLYPSLDSLYIDLHRNPELSLHEEKTAAKLASRMRAAGYEVTEHVGGHGIVAVLKNGDGPTLWLRTDMDALPVKELTGLAYASTVTTKSDAGETVGVMHACGHDIHMVSWLGAASLLARMKDRWHGTVVFIGQPAEEVLQGAQAMVKDRLVERFGKPDFVVGIHDTNFLPAGQVGGAVEPGEFAKSKAAGTLVPGPHSPLFAPDRERTLRTGVGAFTFAALDLLGGAAPAK